MDEAREIYGHVMNDNGMRDRARPWLMGMDMYNDLAPWFGHEPIPPAPLFPTTDKFLINYDKQTSSTMTERSLVQYAIAGDLQARASLAEYYPGIVWDLAITHVNDRLLDMADIKKTYDEMVNICQASGMPLEEVKANLQKALNDHHAPKNGQVFLEESKPMTPEEIRFLKMKFGQAAATPARRGTNRTPPKKRRK